MITPKFRRRIVPREYAGDTLEVKKESREKHKHVPSSTTGIRVVIYRNT